MPDEKRTFTHASILFRPPTGPSRGNRNGNRKMVEAPGTAPGSALLIAYAVYRHSRLPDAPNIRLSAGRRKRFTRRPSAFPRLSRYSHGESDPVADDLQIAQSCPACGRGSAR